MRDSGRCKLTKLNISYHMTRVEQYGELQIEQTRRNADELKQATFMASHCVAGSKNSL